MKVTYGHMGTSAVVFEMLLRDLGHEVIAPKPPNRQTLTLGTRYAPEFACIPFKIVLGTYLEGVARGADTMVSGGGYGPCRAGLYGELHSRILQDLGYSPQFIFFWPPLKKPFHFLKEIKRVKGKNSWRYLIHSVKKAYFKLSKIDDLEIMAQKTRPLEVKHGSTTAAFKKVVGYLKSANTGKEIEEAYRSGLEILQAVPLNQGYVPLKVGVIGEIYVQLEPFANFYLEESLGEMGVEVRRSIYLTQYTRNEVMSNRGDMASRKLAFPYLAEKVGGHGQNSVGDVIRYAKQGYDGVVQLAPFSCIPEIVAKSLMPYLSSRFNIPVLTLFIDEQTANLGVVTRLEAFVDLMHQKREKAAG